MWFTVHARSGREKYAAEKRQRTASAVSTLVLPVSVTRSRAHRKLYIFLSFLKDVIAIHCRYKELHGIAYTSAVFWSYIVLFVLLSQVQVLRNAGEEVTLTVSFLKRAPAFLKLPLNEDCACKPLLLDQNKP